MLMIRAQRQSHGAISPAYLGLWRKRTAHGRAVKPPVDSMCMVCGCYEPDPRDGTANMAVAEFSIRTGRDDETSPQEMLYTWNVVALRLHCPVARRWKSWGEEAMLTTVMAPVCYVGEEDAWGTRRIERHRGQIINKNWRSEFWIKSMPCSAAGPAVGHCQAVRQ